MTTNGEKVIRLTSRPPVIIEVEEWPLVASANGDDWKGRDDSAKDRMLAEGRIDTWSMAVRRHADGRILVYGAKVPGQANRSQAHWFGGELLGANGGGEPSGVQIAAAIEKVGVQGRIPAETVRKCVAMLPPERI